MTFGVGHLPLEVWFKINLLFPCEEKKITYIHQLPQHSVIHVHRVTIYNLHGVHQSIPTPKHCMVKERTYSFPPKDASVEGVGEDTGKKEWVLVVVITQVVVVNCNH